MKSEGQKQSQRHERRLAKKFDGSVTPASGAFWHRKGDVATDRFLIEHKYTAKKSMSLRSDVLTKIWREAVMIGKTPVLAVSIDGKDYVVLTEDDFEELLGD